MKTCNIPVNSQLIPFLAILALTLSTSFVNSSKPKTSTLSEESYEQNVHRLSKGDSLTRVAFKIPDKSKLDLSFPHLKFVNDSTEFHDENERIAKDGKMISGVVSKFGKRSVRGYYPSSSHGGMMMMGANPYTNRYTRFDNRRNSFDSADSGSKSSWGGKWFNTLKRRTSMMMSPMMMPSYDRQQMYQNQGTAEEPDMAATFLNGGGGGGWGQSSHYGKGGVNKSAVGLLGFLSLLSLIQNVLNQTQPMQGGRRKRDVDDFGDYEEELQFGFNDWEDVENEMKSVTPHLLPMLNAVAHAQNGEITVECTLQPICQANQALIYILGEERGKMVGQIISETLSKTLKQAGFRWKSSDWDIGGRVIRAGKSGRNGKNCWNIYNHCEKLDKLPQYTANNPSAIPSTVYSVAI